MKALIFAITFILMASPAFALKVIDAQQETHCVDGYCKTVVDLTKYMNISKISEVESKTISKAYNMSKTLTSSKDMLVYELKEGAKIEKSSHNLFSYKYEKNIMTFEGYVKENVYWNFDLGNGYVIDPWWNSTGSNSTYTTPYTSPSNPSIAYDGNLRGERIKTGANPVMLYNITKYSTTVASYAVVATNSTIIGTYAFSGNSAYPNVQLAANTEYNIWINNTGDWSMHTSASGYPFSADGYQVLSVVQCANQANFPNCVSSQDTNLWINLYALKTSVVSALTSIFYEVSSSTNVSSVPSTFTLSWSNYTSVGLSGYIFSTNNTGAWVNDTWSAFTSHSAGVVKTLNGTIGSLVQWKFYFNNTGNIWSSSDVHNITTTGNIILNVYDEQSQSPLNFNVTAYNSSSSVTVTDAINTTQILGMFGDVTLQVTSAGYGQRIYRSTVTQSESVTINAYLLDETVGTSVIFFVKNNYEQPLEGISLNVSKFIIGVWTIVSQGTTDSIGSTTQFLNPLDVYKFEFFYQNSTKTLNLLPTLTTYYVYFSSGTVAVPSYWDYYRNFTGSCGFANSTRILTCVWNSSMAISNVTLNVISRNATTESTLCLNVSNATNGTIACSFGAPANKTFLWSANVQIGSEEYLFASGTWTDSRPAVNLGINGLIVCFIIVLAAGFVGVQTGNPILIVLLSSIGVAVSILMGFLNLGESALTIIMSLFVSAGVLMYKMRSGQQ